MKGANASDVFAATGKSHTTVTYAFRRTFGTSVVEALANARLDEACRLLRDTDMDIGRIAALSGYTSASYFVQAFKVDKKMAPGAWRRAFRHPPND